MDINIKLLNEELRKLRSFAGETVVLEFLAKAVKGSEDGEKYLRITASNGVAQATVMCSYKGGEEAKKYIVSAKFIDMAESLSGFGDEITVEETPTCLKVQAGDAVIPVELLKDAMTLKTANLRETDLLRVTVETDKLVEAVMHGGYAYGNKENLGVLNGTVLFSPVMEKDEYKMRLISCSGIIVAGSICNVSVKDTAAFGSWVGRYVPVKVAPLSALMKRISGKSVELILTKKQVLVLDGMDVYLFCTLDGEPPAKIMALVEKKADEDFVYQADKDALKKAFAVVAHAHDIYCRVSFTENSLAISDTKKGFRALVPVTVTKETKQEMTFSTDLLKKIVENCPASIRIYKPVGELGLYLEGDGCRSFLLPIKNMD